MAKVRFGGGVVAMAGAIGGDVFTSNASGPLVRARVRGTRRRSPFVTSAQQAFGLCRHRWASLSAALRALWEPYAAALTTSGRFNAGRPLTALQCYVLTNAYSPQLPTPFWLDLPPTAFGHAAPVSGLMSHHFSTFRLLNWFYDGTADGRSHARGVITFQVSAPAAPTVDHAPDKWRFALFLNGNPAPPPPFVGTVHNPWHIDKAAHRQWYRLRQRDSHGRIGSWFQGEVG